MPPTDDRGSANATSRPKAVPKRQVAFDLSNDAARRDGPPNPRTADLRGRWEVAGYAFQPPSKDDPAVNLGQDLMIAPQPLQDFVARAGTTVPEYYKKNPPVKTAQRARLPLNRALNKIDYGKFFPSGMPVGYDTRNIRIRHIREELGPILYADPEELNRATRARDLQDLFSGPARADYYNEIEKAKIYEKKILKARAEGQPMPEWNGPRDPVGPHPWGREWPPSWTRTIVPARRRVPQIGSENTSIFFTSDSSMPSVSSHGASEHITPSGNFTRQPIQKQAQRSALAQAVQSGTSLFAYSEGEIDAIVDQAVDNVQNTRPNRVFTYSEGELDAIVDQAIENVQNTRPNHTSDESEDGSAIGSWTVPIRPPTPPRTLYSSYGPPAHLRTGYKPLIKLPPPFDDFSSDEEEQTTSKSLPKNPLTQGPRVRFAPPPHKRRVPAKLNKGKQPLGAAQAEAQTSWLLSPSPTRVAHAATPAHPVTTVTAVTVFSPRRVEAPVASLESELSQIRRGLAADTPRSGVAAPGPQTRILRVRTARQVREGVTLSWDGRRSLQAEVVDAPAEGRSGKSPRGTWQKFFGKFNVFKR